MGMDERDLEMVNAHYLTMLQHAWVQGGRCQRTIRLIKGFPHELNFPQHRTKGGEGTGFSKQSHTASVLETFDALENRELFRTLETLCAQGGTQLLRGVEIWLASARFVLAFAPTVPGVSRLACW